MDSILSAGLFCNLVQHIQVAVILDLFVMTWVGQSSKGCPGKNVLAHYLVLKLSVELDVYQAAEKHQYVTAYN